MEVSVEQLKSKSIDPIKIVMVIETKRELEYILSLFNASGNDTIEFVNFHRPSESIPYFDSDDCAKAMPHGEWKRLKNIYERL